MKDSSDLTRLICAPHCRFFRPGTKEELSCAGYEFFRRRLDNQEAARAARALAATAAPPPSFARDPRLEKILCAACDFCEADCDFMSNDVPDAVPCGGYVLLARLLAAGCSAAEEWLHEEG